MTWISACVLLAVGIAAVGAAQEDPGGSGPCRKTGAGLYVPRRPSQFLKAQARVRQSIHERVKKLSRSPLFRGRWTSEAAAIVRRNFIDEEIFGKLQQAKVAPARLSSDEEFVRRIFLDLIGRIPSAAQVNEFVQSTASDKRDRLIDSLLSAPEFNDKWAVWFEDLVGMTEILSTSNRRPRIEGRNSFDRWIREQMQNNRSMTEIVKATLTATGNNYYTENGPASFMVLGSAAMGPVQDTYDLQLVKSVSSYLGVGHYDCLLCHSGRGHLDQISVVGRAHNAVGRGTHGGSFRADPPDRRSEYAAIPVAAVSKHRCAGRRSRHIRLKHDFGESSNSRAFRNGAKPDTGVSRRDKSQRQLARRIRKQANLRSTLRRQLRQSPVEGILRSRPNRSCRQHRP